MSSLDINNISGSNKTINVTNRYLRFTYKNLSYNLQLENGIYDTNALNNAFQNLTSYLYPTNGLFSIEPLTSTSQVCIFFMIMQILSWVFNLTIMTISWIY